MKKYTAILICLLMTILQANAIGPYTDPTRALALFLAGAKAKETIMNQSEIQGLNALGHIWIKKEVKETTEFQKEFCEYLDTLGDALSMAAEVYGIYYEVSKTVEHIKTLNKTISRSPTNAFAVALSQKGNGIYTKIIENGIDLVMNIKTIFISKTKLTEAQKYNLFTEIRPKLHAMNRTLLILNLSIKYTNFADVWREITGDQYKYVGRKKKAEIAKRCLKDWKSNVGMK